LKENLISVGCGAVLWAIWRIRNNICFNKKVINDPSGVIFLCCFWLDSCDVLEREREEKEDAGGRKLAHQKMATEIFNHSIGWTPLDRHIG
jgi:hypothetical protein